MKPFALLAMLIVTVAALAHGAQKWEWVTRPADTEYVIYGGDLGDTYAPVSKDVHVAFYVRGRAAREMFDVMGPDKKSECGVEKGGRVRQKENVACRYRPSDGYECDFGFDLTSGRSIGGSIC